MTVIQPKGSFFVFLFPDKKTDKEVLMENSQTDPYAALDQPRCCSFCFTHDRITQRKQHQTGTTLFRLTRILMWGAAFHLAAPHFPTSFFSRQRRDRI